MKGHLEGLNIQQSQNIVPVSRESNNIKRRVDLSVMASSLTKCQRSVSEAEQVLGSSQTQS